MKKIYYLHFNKILLLLEKYKLNTIWLMKFLMNKLEKDFGII